MIDRVEELAEKTPHGAISRDIVEASLSIAVFKQLVNHKLPYLNSYVDNPPIRELKQEN